MFREWIEGSGSFLCKPEIFYLLSLSLSGHCKDGVISTPIHTRLIFHSLDVWIVSVPDSVDMPSFLPTHRSEKLIQILAVSHLSMFLREAVNKAQASSQSTIAWKTKISSRYAWTSCRLRNMEMYWLNILHPLLLIIPLKKPSYLSYLLHEVASWWILQAPEYNTIVV